MKWPVYAASIMITVVIVACLAVSGPLAILPAFEGVNAGVEGVTIGGQFYRVDSALPSGYTWLSADIHNAVLNRDLTGSPDARVRVEVGNPVPAYDGLTEGKKVDYWVKDGDNYVHVTGQVVTYTLKVTLSTAITGTQWPEHFSGERVWLGLTSVTWDKALQEQNPITGEKSAYGQAWEAPLAVYITSYSMRDAGDHGRVDPAYTGRFVTLYSTPEQSGTVSDLLSSDDINATFAGDLRPDTRMQRSAYLSVLLEDFGITTPMGGWFGSSAPVADYELKVYALRIGKFTYNNPDLTPWQPREPESYDPWRPLKEWWAGVTGWFANPLNLAGTFIVLGIALFAVVLVFLFVTGLIVPLQAWARTRSRGKGGRRK